MNLRLITSAAEPITLADARLHLRVDDSGDDSLISALVSAAREHAESFTGRTFTPSTYEVRFDSFSAGCEWPRWSTSDPLWGSIYSPYWSTGYISHRLIPLPLSPVASIVSVKYVDVDGVEQTLDPSAYVLDDNPDAPGLRLPFGGAWPATRAEANAVRVQFVGAPPAQMGAARAAMLLIVGQLYENREEAVYDRGAALQMQLASRTLLTPYRVNMGV